MQELGRTLIPTQKGYVALSLLADIRDLRGSEGESSIVYKGDPAIGIRIYGQETGQAPDTRERLFLAIASLNEEGKGRYQLALVEDHVARLTKAVRDGGYLLAIAALLASSFIGYRQRFLVSILIAATPLSFGWGTGLDFHASFATALTGGILLAGWGVMVLLPAMYQASKLAKLQRAGSKTDYPQLFRVWWENYRIRKIDLREQKEMNKRVKEKPRQETREPGKQTESLSSEDFLPL